MAEQVFVEQAPTESGTVFGSVLVGNASASLLAANASRESFVVSADTADAFLSYGGAAALVGKGVRLKAGGPPFREESWKGAVQIISSGAAVISGVELDYSLGDDQGQQVAGASTFTPSGPGDAAIPAPTQPQQVPPPPLNPSQ